MRKSLLKYKRSQESIGMSFSMIFSLILIIFFLVAAFIAIKYFLDYQKEIQLRAYFQEFQNKIDEISSSAGIVGTDYVFEKNAPTGTDALCYINFNAPTGDCVAIKEQLGIKQANFAFHSSKYDKIMKKAGYKMITGINTDSLSNCFCITKTAAGKIKIRISTTTINSIVTIGAA
jgi:hypothetical protein